MSIHDCKRKHERQLLAKKNVVAVGVGRKNGVGPPCVCVSVTKKEPLSRLAQGDVVPLEVDGQRTDVVEVGRIRALQGPTDRHRPAPPGVSIAHKDVTAGTLGCLVKSPEGELFILSNNHVLANSNDAELGDPILQPGPADNGTLPGDEIAKLARFVRIRFDGDPDDPAPPPGGDCNVARLIEWLLNWIAGRLGSRFRARVYVQEGENLVDAALGRVSSPELVTSTIRGIGVPAGVADVDVGHNVQKSGRTTGLTLSQIQQTDVTVRVSYGGGRTATFVNQILAGDMTQPGDSGSVVLNETNKVVGLLYAGSDAVTVLNPIQEVLRLLEVSVVTD